MATSSTAHSHHTHTVFPCFVAVAFVIFDIQIQLRPLRKLPQFPLKQLSNDHQYKSLVLFLFLFLKREKLSRREAYHCFMMVIIKIVQQLIAGRNAFSLPTHRHTIFGPSAANYDTVRTHLVSFLHNTGLQSQ